MTGAIGQNATRTTGSDVAEFLCGYIPSPQCASSQSSSLSSQAISASSSPEQKSTSAGGQNSLNSSGNAIALQINASSRELFATHKVRQPWLLRLSPNENVEPSDIDDEFERAREWLDRI